MQRDGAAEVLGSHTESSFEVYCDFDNTSKHNVNLTCYDRTLVHLQHLEDPHSTSDIIKM